MSETSGFPQYAGATSQMRTLAVRITDDLRAQLDVIAQLNDRSVTEEIRLSLEDWIERSKSDPQVLKRAETVRADIEREAQTKRNAIEAIERRSASYPKPELLAASTASAPKKQDSPRTTRSIRLSLNYYDTPRQRQEPPPKGGSSAVTVEDLLTGIDEHVNCSNTSMVDPRRFELLTSSMRTRRATNCAKGPLHG